VAIGAAQSSGGALTVEVRPEAYLDPPRLTLSFLLGDQGASTQSATVRAWVRALPNQQIYLTANASNLNGPAGPFSAAALRWNGATFQATAGGQNAACNSGAFDSGPLQQFVSGWRLSGTLSCSVVFRLDSANLYPGIVPQPGLYTGDLELSVFAQ
jgi:hypothetical protein